MNILFSILIAFSFLKADLIIPENFSELNSIHVLFKWDQVPKASAYNIQIATSNSFNNNSIIRDVNINIPIYIEKNVIDWEDTFFWRVRPLIDGVYEDWIDSRRFFTSENKININHNIINLESIQSGLTILGDDGHLLSGAYDSDGRCIWHDGDLDVMLNSVNEYGQLFGFSGYNWPNRTGIEFNYSNDIIWKGPNGVYIDEHEVKQIPNMNYMGFVEEFRDGPIPIGEWTSLYRALGYEADGTTYEFPWKGNRLVEWDRITKQEVWSWNPFDFFSFEEYDAHGGTWYYSTDIHDWMHSNAFYFDEDENSIYMSHRHLSRITKISYPEGQVEWIMGLPCPYMSTCEEHICSELNFSFQHHISVLENGNLLFFDNGNISELLHESDFPFSRVIEVEVLEDNSCDIVWEYTLPEDLFGPFHGSAQKLNNGNYLINTAGMFDTGNHGGTIIEVSNSQDILSITTTETEWGDNVYSYRAYRIPSIHPNAFSLIIDDLSIHDQEKIIDSENNSISLTIYNQSGYDQPYKISLQDIENLIFTDIDTTINIDAYENHTLTIFSNNNEFSSTSINLTSFPLYHSYDSFNETINVNVINQILGDLNNDQALNILDVILMVNIILADLEIELNADMNFDGIVNIQDIILLIESILSF